MAKEARDIETFLQGLEGVEQAPALAKETGELAAKLEAAGISKNCKTNP